MKRNVDPSIRLLAAGYISKQLGKLIMHLQGARSSEDIEDVHQVRVACRRIRAGLRLFNDCFEENLVKSWEKQIKKLLKSFGAARDLDVQIEFLNDVLNRLNSEHKKMRPGILRMLLRWQQRRDSIQSKVIKAIDGIQKKHLLTNIHIHMEKTLFELKPLNISLESQALSRRAREQIHLRLQDLLNRQQTLRNPEDVEGHHSARIAAKKLRYAMEICDTALGGKLKPAIKKIKKVQTLLGDIHDCDVWEAEITRFIASEKKATADFYGHSRPFARILPGLLYLQQERREHRNQLYQQACDYLEQLNEQTFRDMLPQVLLQNEETLKLNRDDELNESTQPENSRGPDDLDCDSV